MSSQDTDAPKRRSSAANRRRRKRQRGASGNQPTEAQVTGQTAVATEEAPPRTRAERKAAARAGTDQDADGTDVPQEKHLRRQQERREAKSRQPEKQRKNRFVNTERFSGLQSFYHDTSAEIKKVIWPDRETTRNLTILVIILASIMGLVLGGIDYVLFQVFESMT